MEKELLLLYVIEKVEKQSFKKILLEYCCIDEIGRDYVRIITNNKMSEMLLRKEDNRKQVEDIINKTNLYILRMNIIITYIKNYIV